MEEPSLVDFSTPPLREAEAMSTREHLPLTEHGADTTLSLCPCGEPLAAGKWSDVEGKGYNSQGQLQAPTFQAGAWGSSVKGAAVPVPAGYCERGGSPCAGRAGLGFLRQRQFGGSLTPQAALRQQFSGSFTLLPAAAAIRQQLLSSDALPGAAKMVEPTLTTAQDTWIIPAVVGQRIPKSEQY
ncbi:hypothetical protein UY3_17905 [Chelonia mydas]|uniref:Uncharacterized protein n=1 Tax=Chelonia mydas TaxID=8469 RepID=M7AKQ0_CHEMY|nr:hypothetical protein UY3_17905 [Chelonia mydas]